ncbi:MAG TPA: hypothetical protein VHV83_20885 [Armatimonadota bacterium]|nr:hypothetical protein [Armatimonadota bacterium]
MMKSLRIFLCGMLLLVLVGAIAWCAEEPAAPTSGTVTGILVAKGENWIAVKADGEKEAVRYMPFWRGGAPNEGGSLDKTMLETIKKLVVPNRVKVVWQLQEHRRIVSVEMQVPTEKSGTITGVVVAKEANWIDVKTDGNDGVVQRYMPRWIGGAPNQGGGFDKTVLQAIAERKVGDHVQLSWTFDERLRVVQLGAI